MKIIKLIRTLTLITLLYPFILNAQTEEAGLGGGLDRVGWVSIFSGFTDVGNNTQSPIALANSIILIILGLLGVIFIIQIIIAGYQYLTSGGNEETIKHAKDRIKTSVIGLLIVLVAYVITSFVIAQLINATSGEGGSGPTGP